MEACCICFLVNDRDRKEIFANRERSPGPGMGMQEVCYVIGKAILLETDHKPLVSLLGKTNLDCLPPRVLCLRIHLVRFGYSISHVPGKLLYTADTLSRATVIPPDANQILEDAQTEAFVHALASYLPASADSLQQFRVAQQQDSTCSQLITFCKQRWPNKSQITGDALRCWPVRGELSLHDDLLHRDTAELATGNTPKGPQWTPRNSAVPSPCVDIRLVAWYISHNRWSKSSRVAPNVPRPVCLTYSR